MIEAIVAAFLCFVVGLLIGYVEGKSQGWNMCSRFYRDEVLPLTAKGKR